MLFLLNSYLSTIYICLQAFKHKPLDQMVFRIMKFSQRCLNFLTDSLFTQ